MSTSTTPVQRHADTHGVDAGCPACGGAALRPFHTVRGIPVHSCLQMDDREAALAHPRGDLELAFCGGCGFVTNPAFRPELLNYSAAYEETQGASPTFNAFARSLAGEWIERYALRGRRVLEIGCGKGEFLSLICEMGGNAGIGFDPAYVPGREGDGAGAELRFRREFYSERHAEVEADFICCRHTLEHIGPVAEFMRMIRGNIGERRGVTVGFEVPALERILEETAFWDLYYEHCSYFALPTLGRLFRRCGFRVLDLRTVYEGQYLVIEAAPGGDGGEGAEDAGELNALRGAVDAFARRAGEQIECWRERLRGWRGQGRRVVLWGSGSKAVGFLTTLGEADALDAVEAVVDINPRKHGRFMPGCRQEIVAPASLRELRPSVVIVMNPIYREEIARDLAELGVEAELVMLQ